MPATEHPSNAPELRRALLVVLLGALVWLCATVLHPFINPVLWAGIITYVSWPVFQRIDHFCGNRPGIAAFVMTVLVTIVAVAPLLVLGMLLQAELVDAYPSLIAHKAGVVELPGAIRSVPGLGDALQQVLDRLAGDPDVLRKQIVGWAISSHEVLFGFFGSVARNIAKLVIAIVTAFFFFRSGPLLVRRTEELLRQVCGDRAIRYVQAASTMTRAVVFGFLLTAFVQGVIAGIGYAVVRADAPVTLGALTMLASIVPVIGTGIVWGVVASTLMLTGHIWQGVALIAWGTLLVHPVDNVLRPLLISNATRVPFLLVMFGVIGGIAAFGLVGLFVGPVTLAVATALWREWRADDQAEQDSANARPNHRPNP